MQEVILEMNGGLIEPIKIPEGVKITIRDYDVDGETEDIEVDSKGKEFRRIELD